MGSDDYLKKPFSLEEFMARVRRLAERQRMLVGHVNDVVESHDILMALWGDDSPCNSRSLQVFIRK